MFILAVSGSAIGLGNIWKFPYITGVNGGGAFVIIYLICIFSIGLPIMISEIMIGRKGKRNPITSMEILGIEETGNGVWKIVGFIGLMAGFLILSFYSVIAGWTFHYFLLTLQGLFIETSAMEVKTVFNQLTQSIPKQLIYHSFFMILTVSIISKGVRNGLEKAVYFMMPALLIIMCILLYYSITHGNFSEGVSFLFKPDFSIITASTILVAMGHAFFTLSLGMGCVVMYGAYLQDHESIFKTSIIIILCDTFIALFAGLIIFPIVFANNLDPGAGPGLIFQTLPLAFGQINGGILFGALFFALISFAALTSAISLLEPSVVWLIEKRQIRRSTAAILMGLLIWTMGLFTILSFNNLSSFVFWKGTIFDNIDFLASNILLPISGLLFTVFASWFMSHKSSKRELSDTTTLQYNIWRFLARYIAPLAVIIILINFIGVF
jgi:neurotransmitter:Na+ symporter, NSS family